MATTYRAIPCPCGQRGCSSWMVDPIAAVQGVGFTEHQARAVADLLNAFERIDPTTRKVPVMIRPELDALVAASIRLVEAMTPEEREAMHQAQRESWARQDRD